MSKKSIEERLLDAEYALDTVLEFLYEIADNPALPRAYREQAQEYLEEFGGDELFPLEDETDED